MFYSRDIRFFRAIETYICWNGGCDLWSHNNYLIVLGSSDSCNIDLSYYILISGSLVVIAHWFGIQFSSGWEWEWGDLFRNILSLFDYFVSSSFNKKHWKCLILIWHTIFWKICDARNGIIFSEGKKNLRVEEVDKGIIVLFWMLLSASKKGIPCLYY